MAALIASVPEFSEAAYALSAGSVRSESGDSRLSLFSAAVRTGGGSRWLKMEFRQHPERSNA
jgi:hypothetical protein